MSTRLTTTPTISYYVSLKNITHHEAEITITFSNIPKKKPLILQMSCYSPGRYSIHEFSRNLYGLKAYDKKDKPLTIAPTSIHQWIVKDHNSSTIKISYTIFGDKLDGTYNAIDSTHAHLNMPATFLWAVGFENSVMEITIDKPKDWKIATQLPSKKASNTFWAPNLQYFMDSPIEVSDLDIREWQIKSKGSTQTIRLAIHHNGTKEEVDTYVRMTEAVIYEQIAIFGELPKFDYGSFTFIADYLPYASGDGMEHRNSTILTSSQSLAVAALYNLGTLSHEFLHIWNVERIRPKGLEPFDFQKGSFCGELWFGEGFTSYYDDLCIHRAQLTDLNQFARELTPRFDRVLNSPASKNFNPVEMSQRAPLVDTTSSNNIPLNLNNTYVSYYSWGCMLAVALDITLRSKFKKITLDHYMRAVWKAHGKKEIPYSNENLQKILAEITQDSKFADDFFSNHIYNNLHPDYENLLAKAGLLLRKAKPSQASLGTLKLHYTTRGAVLLSSTPQNSVLYSIGLDRGDMIEKIDGTLIENQTSFNDVIYQCSPGDIVELEYRKRNMSGKTKIALAAEPRLEIVPYEKAFLKVSSAIKKFRKNWLKPHAPNKYKPLYKHCFHCQSQFPFKFEYCPYDATRLMM